MLKFRTPQMVTSSQGRWFRRVTSISSSSLLKWMMVWERGAFFWRFQKEELLFPWRVQKGGEVLSLKEVTEEKLRNSSVMLLGESWKTPIISKLVSNIPKPIDHKNGSFFIKGGRIDEGAESLLLTFSNPHHPGKWVTIYFGRSASALLRARYIFFYGWDSYILFKNGRPKERGNFSPRSSFISYDFLKGIGR